MENREDIGKLGPWFKLVPEFQSKLKDLGVIQVNISFLKKPKTLKKKNKKK